MLERVRLSCIGIKQMPSHRKGEVSPPKREWQHKAFWNFDLRALERWWDIVRKVYCHCFYGLPLLLAGQTICSGSAERTSGFVVRGVHKGWVNASSAISAFDPGRNDLGWICVPDLAAVPSTRSMMIGSAAQAASGGSAFTFGGDFGVGGGAL